jgi:hypothetical protein
MFLHFAECTSTDCKQNWITKKKLKKIPPVSLCMYPQWLQVAFAVNLRPTVSRPVCRGVRRPSGACDQFLFLLEISFRQLRAYKFVAPSL